MLAGDVTQIRFQSPVRFLHAAIVCLAALAAGYAILGQLDGAIDALPLSAQAAPAPENTAYFPAQYVNQANEPTEHIQAF